MKIAFVLLAVLCSGCLYKPTFIVNVVRSPKEEPPPEVKVEIERPLKP